MDDTIGPDNDTTKSSSPPDVMSKSTNMSQSKTKSTNSGPRQASVTQTFQGRPSYAAMARKALSNEHPDSAAKSSPGAALSRPLRTREAHPADNRSTAVPAAVLRDRQGTAHYGDISGLGVGLGAQSRTGQLQPPADADGTQSGVAHPKSPSKSSAISTSKEAGAAQREDVASPGPILLTSSIRPTTQPRPVTIPPPSHDVPSSQALRDPGKNLPLGRPEPGEQNEREKSSLHQADLSRERNVTKPRAQQVDRTASVQSSARPLPSSPPLNRPSASMSPLPSLPVPALTKTESSQVHTIRGMRSEEFQARSGGAPFELPHHRGEEKGKAPLDEQDRTNLSAPPRRLPLPPGNHAASATELPSQPQPVSAPHRLDKGSSRLQGSEGVYREDKRATEGLASDTKGRKGPAEPKGYESPPEDSATSSDSGKRHKAGPNLNLPTSHTPNVIQHTIAPAESSVERSYSSNPSSGNDSSAPRLPETGRFRGKVTQSSDSATPLGRNERPITPPPLALVSTQNQPKHVIRGSSNSDSTVSSVGSRPYRLRPSAPSVVGDSEIPVTPSGKSLPLFTAFRLAPDSLFLSLSHIAPAIVETSFNPKEEYESRVQLGLLSEMEASLRLRENKAIAALDGQYHSEPFIGRLEMTSSPNLLPIHAGGIMKQKSSSNLNQAKLQLGGLNRPLITREKSTNTFGEGRDGLITTQPASLELSHPLAINTPQVAEPTRQSPSDDGNRGEGSRGSSRGGGPPGNGPPGGGEPPGTGRTPEPEEGRKPRGSTPSVHLGRRSPQGLGKPPGPPSGGEEPGASTSCWPCCK